MRAAFSGWDELLLVVAGTSWDGLWMSEQHIAVELSRRIPVLWVDPPISWLTPLRNASAPEALRAPRLRMVRPGLARLSPITVPGVSRPGLRDIARRQSRRAVRRAITQLGARVRGTIVACIEEPLDVVPSGRTLFYGTDDFVAGATLLGLNRDWLERRERRQLEAADVVVAVSEVLRDKWSSVRSDVVVIPNGCDTAHFADVDRAPLPTDVTLPGPIAGLIGRVSERIDLTCLEAVADRGISLLLVGPIQREYERERVARLLSRPNVQWVGEKLFQDMPSYLRVIDVGLTPYTRSPFNLASFPLKTLDYLAAGREVVATDLPSVGWLDTDLIAVAGSPEEFAGTTAKVLARGRTPAETALRQQFAEGHSWARRAEEIAALMGIPDSGAGAAAPGQGRRS